MGFELGYWGLFLGSFLAATVIPFSSEVMLSAMLFAGFDPLVTLTVATIGNWLGGMSSFGLGWMGKMEWINRYLRVPQEKLDQMHRYVHGKSAWVALFCWLPFVGDVIAVVLGLLRSNIWITTIAMLIGKGIRYAIWGYLTIKTMGL